MSEDAVFQHLGHAFRVANPQSPTPSDIKVGRWVFC